MDVSVEVVDGPIGDASVGWQRTPRAAEGPGVPVGGGRRISDVLIDRLADNSNRREYGMGFVGKLSGFVIMSRLFCQIYGICVRISPFAASYCFINGYF